MPTLNVIRALAVAAALAAAAGPALSQPADTAAARAAAGGAQPMAYSPADSGRPFTVYHVKPDSDYLFYRPRAFEYWPRAVQNLGTFGRTALRRDNLVMLAPIAAATAALWVLDEPIKDGVQRLGDRLHISGHNTDRTRTYLAVKGLPIFRGPSDLGSALYFIGDGWIHIGITTGFYAYGQIAGDDRARQTTSQLLQGLGVTGTVIQILKRSTGRESPGCATAQGGRWRLFPSMAKFNKHTPEYDAFPSGHLATFMMTMTVISGNYPEWKFVKPAGYTLMSLLAFQMVNNGVHWASDYPLGLAVGYTVGKITLARGRAAAARRQAAGPQRRSRENTPLLFYPICDGEHVGLALRGGL